MPGAGDLRGRLTFQKRANDANGDPLGAWANQFSVSAQIVWLRGSEPVLQQRLEGKQPVAFVVRASSQTRQIDTSWRAVNALNTDEKFNITAVSPNKYLGFLDILAVKGGATG